MDLRKTFIKSDTFTNIANIEIESKKMRTLLMLLLKLKIPLNADEVFDFNTIGLKLSANISGKTPQLFARTVADFIIDLYSIRETEIYKYINSLLSENYFPPQSVAYQAGHEPETFVLKTIIPFIPICANYVNFNWGFPFTNALNLEISAPAGKNYEYSVYVLTREYLGDTPFITLQKKSQKVLEEINLNFEDIQKLIYHTIGNITGNENADIFDLYSSEEKYTNIFNLIREIPGAGNVPSQKYSEIIFTTRQSIRLVMNLDQSITADRYFLYRKISNAHMIPIISPVVPAPPQHTIL